MVTYGVVDRERIQCRPAYNRSAHWLSSSVRPISPAASSEDGRVRPGLCPPRGSRRGHRTEARGRAGLDRATATGSPGRGRPRRGCRRIRTSLIVACPVAGLDLVPIHDPPLGLALGEHPVRQMLSDVVEEEARVRSLRSEESLPATRPPTSSRHPPVAGVVGVPAPSSRDACSHLQRIGSAHWWMGDRGWSASVQWPNPALAAQLIRLFA
jgi:hypothetical protein